MAQNQIYQKIKKDFFALHFFATFECQVSVLGTFFLFPNYLSKQINIMKHICLFFLSFFLAITAYSQYLQFEWVKNFSGAYCGSCLIQETSLDNNQNMYVAGVFSDTVDFDPSINVFNMNALATNYSRTDIFITKLDINGNLLWAKRIGADTLEKVSAVASDMQGNVYITGFFCKTTDFDPGAGVFNLSPVGNRDIFVLKLDSNGNFVWAKRMGANLIDEGAAIVVDTQGDVLLSGYFYGTVDFDPNAGVYNITSQAGYTSFITKLSANGDFLWAKSLQGLGSNAATSLAIGTNNEMILSGYFYSTVDFDPNAGSFTLTSTGQQDIYLLKLSANGDFVWAKSMGGNNNDKPFQSLVDNDGNVYTMGDFDASGDFDPSSNTFTLTGWGTFITKLGSDGSFLWAKVLDTKYDGIITKLMVLDDNNFLYIAGSFLNTVDFDPNAPVYNVTSTSANLPDAYILTLQANGDFVNVVHTKGIGVDKAQNLSKDIAGNIYLSGIFSGSCDFGINTNPYTLNIVNFDRELFMLKLNNLSTSIEDKPTAQTIAIYPNPAQDKVFFQADEQEFPLNIEIYSSLGQFMGKNRIADENMPLSLTNLPQGVYYVKCFGENERLIYAKIMKE